MTVRLIDTKGVRHYHSVLESDLLKWVAAGWTEVARDRKPSVAQPIILLEWQHELEPVLP